MKTFKISSALLLALCILLVSCSKEEDPYLDLQNLELTNSEITAQDLAASDSLLTTTRTFRGNKVKCLKKISTKNKVCGNNKFYYEAIMAVMCGPGFNAGPKFSTYQCDCKP